MKVSELKSMIREAVRKSLAENQPAPAPAKPERGTEVHPGKPGEKQKPRRTFEPKPGAEPRPKALSETEKQIVDKIVQRMKNKKGMNESAYLNPKNNKKPNKYKNSISESHPANEQWSESFYETIEKMDMTDTARKYINKELDKIDPIEQYNGPNPINAAKQFVKDTIKKFKEQAKSSALDESVYFDPKSNKELSLQKVGNKWEIDIRKKGDMSFSKPVTIKRDTLEQIKDWCKQYNLPTDWIKETE